MADSTSDRSSGDGPLDDLVDLVFFAPIGLAFEARRLAPELVARGRRQVELARFVGKMAVDRGVRQANDLVDRILNDLGASAERAREAGPTPPGAAGAEAPVAVSATDAEASAALAIPAYDSLAATQVLPRLEGLDPAELEAIRAYEAEHRGRRTILAKIARLQA